MSLRTIFAAAAASAFATFAHAQPTDRWTSASGDGVSEASISTRSGMTFSVVCPSSDATTLPGFAIEGARLVRGPAREGQVLLTGLAVDGRGHFFVFRPRTVEPGETALVWESRAPGGVHWQMAGILRAMQSGRRFRVRIPHHRLDHTFSLTGAREALAGCARFVG